ncbi:MAG: hypothetical protein WCW14_04390 [Candidatus Paceibacterota bacterium]|jgi:hypothetical protein
MSEAFLKGDTMKVKQFDTANYTRAQMLEALTCPINRHCTRVEHGCDDWELFKHPEWLMQHYIERGGAVAFAKRRSEFIRDVEVSVWIFVIKGITSCFVWSRNAVRSPRKTIGSVIRFPRRLTSVTATKMAA